MSEDRQRADHDGSYRKLFEHALMVQQLIEVFVGAEVAALLDFARMEHVNGVHLSETLVRRENDLLWKIHTRGGAPLYILLMVEFQSSPDHAMAVRILTYVMLYYDALVRDPGWSLDDGLPPILPVVIYNGEREWTAKEDVGELIHVAKDSFFWDFRPRAKYYLIKVRDFAEDELQDSEDLVSILFLLEKAKDPRKIHAALELLIERALGEDLDGIRRGFLAWIGKVLYRRTEIDISSETLDSLTEVKDMLAKNMDRWFEDAKKEGFAKGVEEGIEQGIEQGLEQGAKRGRADGLRESVSRLLDAKFGAEDRQVALQHASYARLVEALPLILSAESEVDFWAAFEELPESD